MNFMYAIRLMCWNYLIDMITQQKKKQQPGRRQYRGRARPFIVSVPAVASVLAVSVSVVCDQVDQVVPAHITSGG